MSTIERAPDPRPERTPTVWTRLGLVAGMLAAVVFVVFWTWALFFASKTAVNRIEDREWAARAETICAATKAELIAIEGLADADLTVRADLVVRSTDLMAAMLDDLMAVPPADPKGQAIVPDWIAEYRLLLADRYAYAERLRAGENVPFSETAVRGVPVTERLETFAADNEMDSCKPPRGSVI